MASLVFHLEDDREIVVPLLATVTFGSAEGNDVLVEDSSIAPAHAEVSRSMTGNFVVRDLGSDAGTFVNGRRIKAHPLCDGDDVAFGNLRGRFELDEEDRVRSEEREEAEREARRKVEKVEKEFDEARAKHVMLMGVLQGLGEEEKKRLENLDKLQRAINAAETALAHAEAGAKSARDESLRLEGLRAESVKLKEELESIRAGHEAALAEQSAAAAAAKKEMEVERVRIKKEVEDERRLAEQGLENEKAAARKQFDEQKAALRKQIKELTSKQEAAERKLAVTEAQHKEVSGAVEARERVLAELRADVAAAEASLKGLKTAVSDAGSERDEAVRAKEAAVESQAAESESLERLRKETEGAARQLEVLSGKQVALETALGALEISVRDMTQRQGEGIRGLRERERNLREALKGIEKAEAAKAEAVSATMALKAQQGELEQALEKLRTEIGTAKEQIAKLDEIGRSKDAAAAALDRRIAELETERDGIRARVKSLADTESNLLEAKRDLEDARGKHAEYVAIVADRDARQKQLEGIISAIGERDAARANVERALNEEREALQKFRDEAAVERQRLTTELGGLESGVTRKGEELAALLKRLEDTTQKHEKLLQHSRELAGVEEQLRRVRADLAQVQREQTAMAERTVALTKDSEVATLRLEGLQKEVKEVSAVLVKRRDEETALNRMIAGLQAEQTVESKRLDEIRHAAADAAQKAAKTKAEMDAEFAKRRQEILEQDDQFHAMVALREDIDALYAQIEAGSPDTAPALLAAWQEARKKREELTGLLPKEGGIRVRPQGRTVLVRRAKEG